MALLTCPICECTFDSEKSPAMPFCSEKCRLIDLGRWLDERYGIPVEREAVAGDEEVSDV
ncbi:MAG: hypothetical protein KatS3mg110_2980 [Pirellulaceae bacterium]|nr:MAG: hypothetical protein KatS3mg110_2980 [Pirellulaceae bacterium]